MLQTRKLTRWFHEGLLISSTWSSEAAAAQLDDSAARLNRGEELLHPDVCAKAERIYRSHLGFEVKVATLAWTPILVSGWTDERIADRQITAVLNVHMQGWITWQMIMLHVWMWVRYMDLTASLENISSWWIWHVSLSNKVRFHCRNSCTDDDETAEEFGFVLLQSRFTKLEHLTPTREQVWLQSPTWPLGSGSSYGPSADLLLFSC